MPDCLIRRLTPQGLEPVDYRANSLADAVQYEPEDGLYTVSRTYNRDAVLLWEQHLDRLTLPTERESLDREGIREALRACIAESSWPEVRFRLTVSTSAPEICILTLEPFQPPGSALLEDGVQCALLDSVQRDDPKIKSTDWMHQRSAQTLAAHIYMGILQSPAGELLEGTGANFYAIKGGELYTAHEGILEGTSRRIVMEIAPKRLRLVKRGIRCEELVDVEEAFMSSSSRGIFPVVAIDAQRFHEGKRGPLTAQLQQDYDAWTQAHLTIL